LAASFFIFKDETLVLAITAGLALIIAGFFIKLNLINLYLKKCKYPYEFLSVLGQLELTKDLHINWSEDLINGPDKSRMMTSQFLEDNNLKTGIGEKKINLPFSLAFTILSVLGLLYFSQQYSFQSKPVVFVSLILLGITNFFLWTKGRKQQNDIEPILIFSERGLIFNNQLYEWDKIKEWTVKGLGKNNKGEMRITFIDLANHDSKVIVDLNHLNIDRIDFMLLLTHYKARYGG
jgi:hypothetical protein